MTGPQGPCHGESLEWLRNDLAINWTCSKKLKPSHAIDLVLSATRRALTMSGFYWIHQRIQNWNDCRGVVSHRKQGLVGKNEMLFRYVLSGYSLSRLFLFLPGCHFVTVSSPVVLLPWFLNHWATVVKSANQTELQNLCAEITPPDVYIATENWLKLTTHSL